MIFYILIILLTLLLWIVYDHQSYFKKRNVKYLKSFPFLGCLKDTIIGRKGIYENFLDIYNTPELKDEPFFGIFMFHKPAILLKDPELIKKILVTNFNSFGTRYGKSDVHDPIGYYQLLLARYPEWKQIRTKLSPFFTKAKLKSCFYLIDKLGYDLNQFLWTRLENNSVEVDVKNMANLFFADVISSIAFGVEAHSLANSGSEIRDAANSSVDFSIYRSLELTSVFLIPQITKTFNFLNMGRKTTEFIYKVCPDIIEHREKSGVKRNDMIDMLIELKKDLKPSVEGHTVEDMMYAQVAVFLTAAYETSSITTSFALYELSRNEEIQNRLRAKIKKELESSDGKIIYESVSNNSTMPYLHQIINETLRIYSVLPFIERKCIDPNGFSLEPFSDFKIPFDMPIFIPIYGLGKDEKYFADPNKFDPERFSPENIQNIPACVHIPFGIGQRYCLGERLAWVQVKKAICDILKDFRVEMTESTPKEMKFKKNALLIQPEKLLKLKFVKDPLY